MPFRKIAWESDYELGIERIDAQHLHLFEIVNKIYALTDNDKIKEEIKTILHELNDYMREHFEDEERYMEKIGFPEIEEHRLFHANIIEQLTHFVKTPNHRLDILQTKMKIIAKKLLIDHIIYDDMKIKVFVEASLIDEQDDEIIEL